MLKFLVKALEAEHDSGRLCCSETTLIAVLRQLLFVMLSCENSYFFSDRGGSFMLSIMLPARISIVCLSHMLDFFNTILLFGPDP